MITVPAHATDAQRKATKSAAEAAGIEVLRRLEGRKGSPWEVHLTKALESISPLPSSTIL